jgi:hypothetical protein
MTQYSYTNSDCNDGSWTNPGGGTGALNADISDTQPLSSGADSNYVWSEEDGSMSSDELTLHLDNNITDPGASASSHIVYFRFKGDQGSGMGYLDLTVALVQGANCGTPGSGTIIATKTVTTGGSFADDSLVLNSTQSGNITDYTDLQLRFTRDAGTMDESVYVSQAYFAAPAVPSATEDFRVNDRVKETTTSTGTGTINLAGAATGYQTFVAGIGNGNMTYYVIEDANNAWEVGIGKVTDASPDTLSRDKIISNSSGNTSAITLSSGTHNVFCGSPSQTSIADTQIKTGTYTVTQEDSTILCDSTSAFTVTMPTAAAGYLGLKVLIKKVTDDTNIVTISSSGGSDFEDEDASGGTNTLKLHLQGDSYELMCSRISSYAYQWVTVNKNLTPHSAQIEQRSTQSIANVTTTTIDMTHTLYSQGCTADLTNNYIKITRKGKYLCGCHLRMQSMTSENKYIAADVQYHDDSAGTNHNRGTVTARPSHSDKPAVHMSTLLDLDVDDYVIARAYHNHGSARNTDSATADYSYAYLFVQEVR